MRLQFHAGIIGTEVPINGCPPLVALLLPGSGLGTQVFRVRDAPGNGLEIEHIDLMGPC